MNRIFLFILILLLLMIAVVAGLVWMYLKSPRIEVQNFSDCLRAGYPVMESYPRQCKTPDGRTFVEDIGNELEKIDLIRVTNPRPNQEIESPFLVKGEARGFWFFEADFPIKIFDENGVLLGSTVAQAQTEWMTEDFVPFQAELEFNFSTTKKGILVLEKDNPSGLPENADELRIPVIFKKVLFPGETIPGETIPGETMKVKAYFNNDKLDPEFSCNKVFPVERTIPKTQSVARAALEEILKGPTEKEKNQGFFTSINPGVKIQSLSIEEGVAKVDFNEQLEYQVGGSCKVSAIRAQINETLKQFPTVDNAIISIDGRTEDILQP